MLILTRPEVIDVRSNVTVAEITTSPRGLAVEVEVDAADVGLGEVTLGRLCDAINTATGC